ncbi:MAG: methyltransferase, partial [Planctomycetota bacterium]
GMASATRPGGIVIFTLEVGADDGPGFELQGHGRYRHSEGYVRESVGSAGFELRDLQRCVLRTEGGKKVGGFAVTARRP